MEYNPIGRGICPAKHDRLQDLPGWVDGLLDTHCGQLEAYAKAHKLRLPKWTNCRLAKGQQLGCGAYGCVFDTKDRDTVFKLTADETEAHFIGCYRRLQEIQGWRLDGMTHYRDIVALKGVQVEVHSELPRMQVYAVWREAADCVGDWDHAGGRMRVKGMLPGVSFRDLHGEQGTVSRLEVDRHRGDLTGRRLHMAGSRHLGSTTGRRYRFLGRAAIARWRPLAKTLGVSRVARGSRGFLRAYSAAGYSAGGLPESWRRKREGFIKRHMAQVRKRREPLWRGGKPTRRHLALIMWAYSPEKA